MSDPEFSEAPQTAIPSELDKPKLLIGEGKDEVRIFGALLIHLGLDDVKVEEYGGKDNLPYYLDALVLRPGFANLTSLGVTRDADTDALSAFTSLSNHLNNREFVTPSSSGNIEAGSPRVGIMILPDGQRSGMLEDVCLDALQTDLSIRCVDEYFECVRATKESLPNLISKARIHAWLATQNPPDMRLGIAAQRGFIDWNSPAFNPLKDFLTAL
ncbi:MAG: DUF3226 domain-containing protein [Pyrinomonadaceae bacterium]